MRPRSGFVIYQLSGSFTVAAVFPADKLQHRESRLRLSVFLLPYLGSPLAGLPRFYNSAFPSRGSGAHYPAPPRFFLKKEKGYNHYITIRK